ncbi:MAG: hypothetical protein ACNYPE_02835 [Candidatus Azotimanducaceae bacterium WSBS_2022_MAG_OTU7]
MTTSDTCSKNYRRTIEELSKNYRRTIEELSKNPESIDHLLPWSIELTSSEKHYYVLFARRSLLMLKIFAYN